jgi:glycerate dehydrogenase
MKIVILDGFALNPGDLSWDGLRELGDLTVYDRTPEDKIIDRIGKAEFIFTNKTPLTKAIFEACPDIRYVGVLATGYNVVDVDAAKEKGVTVCNVPAYSTDSVAQLVFALLLEICHHTWDHSLAVKKGDWTKSPDFCFWNHPLFELNGKIMGIIGYGRIGQAVSKLAQAFGMSVLSYTRTKKPEIKNKSLRFVTLDELLEKSDIISLHCPLFHETEGLISKDSINKCKDGVIVINTSRGGLVIEEDMKAALDRGKVAYFAADVVSAEPIKPGNPLLHAPNTILTPHIAWAPLEARTRLMNTAIENLRAFLSGCPQNVVNK